MKIALRLGLAVLSLFALSLIGCSDDDNTTNSNTPPIMVQGAAYLNGGQLGGYLEFWDVTYSGVHPDSVRVGTQMIDDISNWYWVPNDAYYAKSLWDLHDSSYSAGDSITITVYYADEMATVRIHLFDRNTEEIEIYIASDSVQPLNTDLQLTWKSIANTEYYGIVFRLYSYDATLGGWPYVQERLLQWTTTDTTLTVPGSVFSEIGGAYITISGISGPRPTAEGVVPTNVSTPSMRGQLYGYTQGWGSLNFGENHGFSPVVPGEKPDDQIEFLKLIVRQ